MHRVRLNFHKTQLAAACN